MIARQRLVLSMIAETQGKASKDFSWGDDPPEPSTVEFDLGTVGSSRFTAFGPHPVDQFGDVGSNRTLGERRHLEGLSELVGRAQALAQNLAMVEPIGPLRGRSIDRSEQLALLV